MTKKTDEINIAIIQTQLADIKIDLRDIKEKLEKDYVTVDQFDPVKRVVYGLVSLLLIGVVGALLALVIRK